MAGARPGTSEVLIWAVPGAGDGGAVASGVALAELSAPEAFRPAVSITSLASGGNLMAFVTSESRLYLMDLQPPSGQSDIPRIVQALRSEKVESVSCGGEHVVVMVVGGSLYALQQAPKSAETLRARGAALASSGRLSSLQLPARAIAVSCGTGHVLIATDTGTVFAFGDGSRGQLGLGDHTSRPTPTLVRDLTHLRAVGVAAGHAHSCAVTSFGNLFTWGDNQHGQLGDGSQTSKASPQLVSSIESVRTVVAANATAAFNAAGASFAWGFAGRRAPSSAFERPVGRLALSGHVLCAVSLDGELLLRALVGPTFRTFIAQRGIAAVAAAGGHVVALGGAPPHLPPEPSRQPSPPKQLGVHQPQPPRSPSPAKSPAKSVSPRLSRQTSPGKLPPEWMETVTQLAAQLSSEDPMKLEAAELQAANVQLGMQLDEVRAESLFESARVRRVAEAARKRSSEAWLVLEKERGEASRVDTVMKVLGLQEELASLRAELRESGNAELAPLGARAAPMADAVARDLGDKRAQLSVEHRRLCEEREGIQTHISSVRAELTESGQQLKRIEDACVRTRSMAERQRIQVTSMQEQALRAESDLLQVQERLPSAALERSRLEEEASLQRDQTKMMTEQNAQLQLAQAELSTRLTELEATVEGQSKEHKELMDEARVLTQQHSTEEQSLARQQLTCSRLEGQVAALQFENAQAQKQVRELQEASENSGHDVKNVTDTVTQHCRYLQMQLGSGIVEEGQRTACLQTMVDLRWRLGRAETDHQVLQASITERASKFAEETEPLYSEVQRLHAALLELRKSSVISGTAVDQGPGLAAAMPRQASSSALGPGGRADSVADYQQADLRSRPAQPPSQMHGDGLLAMAGQTLRSDALLHMDNGRGTAFQGNAGSAKFGWADGEVNKLVSQLHESAARREEIRQRMDLRRLGRV